MRGWGAPATLGTQAWAPFPTPRQSFVSKFLLHLSTGVSSFRATLDEGVGCVLHSSWHHCSLEDGGFPTEGRKGSEKRETFLISSSMGWGGSLPPLAHRYIHVLGKETFLMHWPANGTVGKKELLDQLAGFSDYMHTHGCES